MVKLRVNPIRRILIYFGGADTHNLTLTAANALLDLHLENLKIDVVIHSNGPHANVIRERFSTHQNVKIHEGLPSLSQLMLEADLAIGACGSSAWERCCLGLPAIVITVADNQKPIATSLLDLGCIDWIGDQSEIAGESIMDAVLRMTTSNNLTEMSRKCLSLLDGLGTERVIQQILLASETEIKPRLAQPTDEAILLQLANDPLARTNSFQSKLIDEETHHKWLSNQLADSSYHRIYILEAKMNCVVGVVRFDLSEEEWELSFVLAPEVRGKGYGIRVLRSAIATFCHDRLTTKIVARVKPTNIPSQRIFQRLGFSVSHGADEIVYRHLF